VPRRHSVNVNAGKMNGRLMVVRAPMPIMVSFKVMLVLVVRTFQKLLHPETHNLGSKILRENKL
jgi:hypothetical protein